MLAPVARALIFLLLAGGCASKPAPVTPGPPWLEGARIQVLGEGVSNQDCRNGICQHNENTDLIGWNGAVWLVHRTAKSQVLGPNSALHVYRSRDGGASFDELAILQAPGDRDLRDPHFYVVGAQLYIKALTRLPVTSTRDSNVETIAVGFRSSDGATWESLNAIGPVEWSFWRIQKHGDTWYTAAYHDGDTSVALFTSTNGVTWTQGPDVYTKSEDTPLETELTFLPDETLLALVRTDGNDQELLGGDGRLRTQVCIARPPYSSFSCPSEVDGERWDGPLTFYAGTRLFVVARKHLGPDLRKRTALYELSGDLANGMVSFKEWGELPSAGDTAYAGVAPLTDGKLLLSWYSGCRDRDENWVLGILGETDIWVATLDTAKLQ